MSFAKCFKETPNKHKDLSHSEAYSSRLGSGITALTIISEIVDIQRFSTPWKLVGYAGLAPSKRESGTTHRIGDGRRIIRQGSRWIRFTIVESPTTAIMYDDRISKFYRSDF